MRVLALAHRGRLLHPRVNVQAMQVTSSLLALICQVTSDWYCRFVSPGACELPKAGKEHAIEIQIHARSWVWLSVYVYGNSHVQ